MALCRYDMWLLKLYRAPKQPDGFNSIIFKYTNTFLKYIPGATWSPLDQSAVTSYSGMTKGERRSA